MEFTYKSHTVKCSKSCQHENFKPPYNTDTPPTLTPIPRHLARLRTHAHTNCVLIVTKVITQQSCRNVTQISGLRQRTGFRKLSRKAHRPLLEAAVNSLTDTSLRLIGYNCYNFSPTDAVSETSHTHTHTHTHQVWQSHKIWIGRSPVPD
jgi:hypothetical protein